MKDIEGRADIDRLMRVFYERALADDVIGYIFSDIAKLDLESHLPIIGDFWETLLFQKGNYQKHGRNPLEVHKVLNHREDLTAEHFDRWLHIFGLSVDEQFAGPRSEFLKMRASSIALRIQEYIRAADPS